MLIQYIACKCCTWWRTIDQTDAHMTSNKYVSLHTYILFTSKCFFHVLYYAMALAHLSCHRSLSWKCQHLIKSLLVCGVDSLHSFITFILCYGALKYLLLHILTVTRATQQTQAINHVYKTARIWRAALPFILTTQPDKTDGVLTV